MAKWVNDVLAYPGKRRRDTCQLGARGAKEKLKGLEEETERTGDLLQRRIREPKTSQQGMVDLWLSEA